MAAKDKEVQHECIYVGPHEEPEEYLDKKPLSPSSGLATQIALNVLTGNIGRYRSTAHFQTRMAERDFDVFEVEYVIRNGKCIDEGEFCEDLRHHKYTFRGCIDGVDFDAVFALSADSDLLKAPLLILISGCFKTKTGRRGKTY